MDHLMRNQHQGICIYIYIYILWFYVNSQLSILYHSLYTDESIKINYEYSDDSDDGLIRVKKESITPQTPGYGDTKTGHEDDDNANHY